MGWKGNLRAISAAARRMEKEAERRHKQATKGKASADANEAVSQWEEYIDDLLTMHTNLIEYIDWDNLLKKPMPAKPKEICYLSDHAASKLANFKPKLFDFLSGGSSKRHLLLQQSLEDSIIKEKYENSLRQEDYSTALSEWQNERNLAKRLKAGESAAIQEVITEFLNTSAINSIGSEINFSVFDDYVHAKPLIHSEDIIPNFRRKQLASGKLSETKMPKSQFNELYQDYVASIALKLAGDLFQILPLDEVYVTCKSEMLNKSTGHTEATPILSVQFVRATMIKLNLTDVDPSDAMSNFNHAMTFSKAKGFSAISPLKVD